MRVIAGEAKGHQLKVPKGTTVRPATDLVRGAIFSILETIASDWSQVLDLFSGSGALGIEALSRGAGWVDFVDREPRCCTHSSHFPLSPSYAALHLIKERRHGDSCIAIYQKGGNL
jgi:16S rRNA (guanine(966)-N(2))-methyltransferase RsmD